MITFLDGPDAGVRLLLKRAPYFLRVVRSAAGVWDALDQLDDEAEAGETIAVYRRVSQVGRLHIDFRRGKGARSGWYVVAEYRLHSIQPDDATARTRPEWRKCCEGQAELMRQPKREKT